MRFEIEKCANSFDLSAETVSDEIIDDIVKATGSKFGMRAYKQLVGRVLGETFADYLESEPETKTIELTGNLDSVKVIPICNDSDDGDDDIWDEKHEYPF